MAINRAPFNALRDDDGTNTIGSPWNKQAIKDVILDPVDAAIVAGAALPPYVNGGVLSDTGTRTDYAIPFVAGRHTWFYWTGAADLTINGIAANSAPEGTAITIGHHGGVGAVLRFGHGVGTPVNQCDNIVTSGPTPVAAAGFITYAYISGLWRIVAHQQGDWITPPFNAAAFTSDVGSWTVTAANLATDWYRVDGRMLTFHLWVVSSVMSGSPTLLRRAAYGGFTTQSYQALNGLRDGLPQFAYMSPGAPGLIVMSTPTAGQLIATGSYRIV